MPGTAPWDLVGAVRDGAASGVFEVEDPAAVAAELAGRSGVAVVDERELPAAVAAAQVGLAALLVERARAAEAAVVAPIRPPVPGRDDEADADRQAVRFALVILLLALPAGVAVHVVDGTWLASALPAAALLALGVVVLLHRRRGGPASADVEDGPLPQPAVDDSPAVRAAEAHLRRQQAAWKLAWWERGEPVPELGRWSAASGVDGAVTLVVVDHEGRLDEGAHATMTASAPAAVRVVVLRARS